MALKKYCMATDLVDDAALIAEYKRYHQNVSPEIVSSFKDAGVSVLDLYCVGNRLCMILEADDDFTFEKKEAMDAANEHVQKWEALMWKFQQGLPWAAPGQKWMVMEKIFELP